jgi:L-ascorbate metabolism protein UlaG (beta-lactamase superfamily)
MAVTVTYHGQACVQLAGPDGTVLIDPFMDDNPLCTVRADEVECDAIGVTHGHADHLGDTVRIARRTGATVFATYELARFLQGQGVEAHAMHIGGTHEFPFGQVKLFPAFHGGLIEGGDAGGCCTPCGIIVRMGGLSIYHAGDTSLMMEMELLGRYDWIDLALLPIGDNYTMGPQDAVHAVEMIEPRVVVPMHFGTFPVIEQEPEAFRAMVEEQTDARCVVLAPGESFELE